MTRLNGFIDAFNVQITANNAQLLAAEDSAALKADIEKIRDTDIGVTLMNEIIKLRDETVEISGGSAANSLRLGDKLAADWQKEIDRNFIVSLGAYFT